ncbi:MAG TPA: sigma-70 family RNA polymerase sigma factor [bacterium]|nr:sigma-70 family RNA polymerase sigma factor [bacterium]
MPLDGHDGQLEQPILSPQAFGDLYDTHYPRVFRFLVGRLRSAQIAEELTAEVFAIALAALRKGTQPRQIGSWLIGVADHLASRHWRRRKVEERIPPRSVVEEEDPEELAIGRLESAMLWDCVNALSPEHRQVLLLRVVAGLRAREVGDIMNRTEEAVRSLQLRALSVLRSLWKEASPVDPVPGAPD